MDERDIYRTAKLVIDKYGVDARAETVKRTEIMIERGDPEGAAAWMRIMRAIEELQSTGGGAVH